MINLIFNHWIWDEPYVATNRNNAFKKLDNLLGSENWDIHVSGDRIDSPEIWGYCDDDLVMVYHTVDLPSEKKKEIADIAMLICEKNKRQKVYIADITVIFNKISPDDRFFYQKVQR